MIIPKLSGLAKKDPILKNMKASGKICFFVYILVMVNIGLADYMGRVLFTLCGWMSTTTKDLSWPRKNPDTISITHRKNIKLTGGGGVIGKQEEITY